MMADYDALKLENQLCFPLYAASREVIKRYYPFLDAIDLTYTQYIAMMVLWEEKEISVKELGHKLFLDSGTLTPLLKCLEAKGLITRSRSLDDERVVIARVTEEGEALKERASVVPKQMAGCIRLEPEEAKQLYGLLYKLLRSED
ncbi:MAG: MarR family transcriptional regulator [Oscillospiraceae bacterium]|nr:MarR family transcriptional regulator [Oscillospiraceae bacterium]MBR0450998.1 MarR family transcriptional regulator [Oscillospiraceae bacterium]